MQSGHHMIPSHHDMEIAPPPVVVTHAALQPPVQPGGRRSGQEIVVCHDLDGLLVRRNDAHHTLIIDGIWLRLPPLEYRVVLPLLLHFNRPVSVSCLVRAAFSCASSNAEAQRLYRHIYRVRPKLAAFGLCLVSLNRRRGYMLLREESLIGPDDSNTLDTFDEE